MEIPNDLIKSIDYDKAKSREVHEFKCINGKIIHQYALGGEHEMTNQEIIDCLNAIATIDCDLQAAYAFINEQKSKIAELKIQLNKAKLQQNIEEVNEGKWLLEREPDGKPYYLHCSVCDSDFSQMGHKIATPYCPECGARLKTDKVYEVTYE